MHHSCTTFLHRRSASALIQRGACGLLRPARWIRPSLYRNSPNTTLQLSSAANASSEPNSRTRFTSVFPIIRQELLDYFRQSDFPDEAVDWFRRSLNWNVLGGKLIRGLAVVDTTRILRGAALSEEDSLRASVLGWCLELAQAAFLVSDDIMDAGITRRGQPCWYRVEGVGMVAINDAFLLENAIYYLLKKHFRGDPYYVDLLELFHEATFQTFMGELLDLITAPEDVADLSKFSMTKCQLIATYKTAYYSLYLPVALAMRLVGITPAEKYTDALSILIPLGQYGQAQDDYLDCYGAPETIGKTGTDIQNNKCSWNINVALENCTPEQCQVLEANYGRKSAECEARVKAVFAAVDIPGKYAKYEAAMYEKISKLINALPVDDANGGGLKKEVFWVLLHKLYKRTK